MFANLPTEVHVLCNNIMLLVSRLSARGCSLPSFSVRLSCWLTVSWMLLILARTAPALLFTARHSPSRELKMSSAWLTRSAICRIIKVRAELETNSSWSSVCSGRKWWRCRAGLTILHTSHSVSQSLTVLSLKLENFALSFDPMFSMIDLCPSLLCLFCQVCRSISTLKGFEVLFYLELYLKPLRYQISCTSIITYVSIITSLL